MGVRFVEKYRLVIAILLGAVLSLVSFYVWNINNRRLENSLNNKVAITGEFIVQQLEDVFLRSVDKLQNIKHRLEVTGGDYFEYWNNDAALIVEQDTSFLFIEWIDSSMVIQRVEPLEGNEGTIGFSIADLDYRNSDWIQAREDSVINITHWLNLVQGYPAFLMDSPVYIDGEFQGTITAGVDFTEHFNEIMERLNEYHITIVDDRGEEFYHYGLDEDTDRFGDMAVIGTIQTRDSGNGTWTVTVVPNVLFGENNSMAGFDLSLVMAMTMSILFSVIFFFMQKSSAEQRKYSEANRKLRALIDSSPIGIYVVDQQGTVVDFWNNAAERMFGWKKEEVVGSFLPTINEELYNDFQKIINDVIQERGLVNHEVNRARKDGTSGTFRLNIGKITGDDPQMLVLSEDITKEKEFEQKLKKSLHEKEILLAEIHHRVKNNLALVVGLIELHKSGIDDSKTRFLLNETQNRIFTISGVHELLYHTEDFSEISFDDYINKLIDRIKQTYQLGEKPVKIKSDIGRVNVNINQAIPLGLLLNELLTNSFKYAFDEVDKAVIRIELREKDGQIRVTYEDNGSGFDISAFDNPKTLGISLVKTLIEQLEGEYSVDSKPGFHIHFQFGINNKGVHSILNNPDSATPDDLS